jgi:hypothetical protein
MSQGCKDRRVNLAFAICLLWASAVLFLYAVSFAGQDGREVPRVPEQDPNFQPRLESSYPLEMTDGYFFIRLGQPVHLMHGAVDVQIIQLGEEYSMWFTLTLRDGKKNPCSSRDEVPCRFEFQRIPKDSNHAATAFKRRHEFRMGPGGSTDLFFNATLPRSSPLGEMNQVVRVRRGDDILYVYELPLRIVK